MLKEVTMKPKEIKIKIANANLAFLLQYDFYNSSIELNVIIILSLHVIFLKKSNNNKNMTNDYYHFFFTKTFNFSYIFFKKKFYVNFLIDGVPNYIK